MVKTGRNSHGGLKLIYITKKQNFDSFSNCRYCAHRAHTLPGPAPNIWLTMFQISFKLVHFGQSYSRSREGRSLGPWSICKIRSFGQIIMSHTKLHQFNGHFYTWTCVRQLPIDTKGVSGVIFLYGSMLFLMPDRGNLSLAIHPSISFITCWLQGKWSHCQVYAITNICINGISLAHDTHTHIYKSCCKRDSCNKWTMILQSIVSEDMMILYSHEPTKKAITGR